MYVSEFTEYLAYARVDVISTVRLSTEHNRTEPGGSPKRDIRNKVHMKNVIGLAVDVKNRRYFYSDIQLGQIKVVSFLKDDFTRIVDSRLNIVMIT